MRRAKWLAIIVSGTFVLTVVRRYLSELSQNLESYFCVDPYTELVLVAPPNFLGAIRKELSNAVQKLVVAEMAKELTQFSLEEIDAHLKRLNETSN